MPHVAGIAEDSPPGARISERRSEIFKSRYLPHLRSFPRVRELVQRAHEALPTDRLHRFGGGYCGTRLLQQLVDGRRDVLGAYLAEAGQCAEIQQRKGGHG